MDWLFQYIGIPDLNTMDVSIPKEKVTANVKTDLAKKAIIREFNNINEINYHAIIRGEKLDDFNEELHIIEVVLSEPKYIKPIAEAFQQAIPYSKVIIFASGDKYVFFNCSQFSSSISQYDYSDWVYKEELMVDFDLGVERQPAVRKDETDIWALTQKIRDIFYDAEQSDYISLRHYIDDLKIREIQYGREYVQPIISELAGSDKIEYFADFPFVLRTDADAQYQKRKIYSSSFGSVEDGRFGIDRRFEPLTKSDFTTVDEMMLLLDESAYSFASQPDWE